MARNVNHVRLGCCSGGWQWCRGALVLALFAMLPLNLQAASFLPDQSPTEAVQRTMKEVLYILTELKDTSRSVQRQWEIEQVVRRSFNYEEMAERSLGEAWTGLSPTERRQYVRLFVQLLRDELADRLREYNIGQVAYLSEQSDKEGTRVTTAPAGSEIDTRIEFQVVHRSGAWLMNDLNIDGASIVANYQAQFSRILRDGSFAELMERMKQKGLVAKVLEKAES
jgi:ABC-type transport system involved in resistance to organic solvents, auxiliary component